MIENRVSENKKYTFVSETLYLIDKSEIIQKSNIEEKTINIEDASRVIRSVSKMEGMKYYSLHRKEESGKEQTEYQKEQAAENCQKQTVDGCCVGSILFLFAQTF